MLDTRSITTDTHNIVAYYDLIEGGFASGAQYVNTNGDTLEEITNDLIEFFNGSEETAEAFEIYRSNMQDTPLVEVRGKFFKGDGEGGNTTDTIGVQVVILAHEK